MKREKSTYQKENTSGPGCKTLQLLDVDVFVRKNIKLLLAYNERSRKDKTIRRNKQNKTGKRRNQNKMGERSRNKVEQDRKKKKPEQDGRKN